MRGFKAFIVIVALVCLVIFFLSRESKSITNTSIPTPFGGKIESTNTLGASVTEIGVSKTGRRVFEVAFEDTDTETLKKDGLSLVITPADTSISHGAPLSVAFPPDASVYGYAYLSKTADLERERNAALDRGEPMAFADLFPGKFFASERQREGNPDIREFSDRNHITFFPLSDVPLERDMRYALVVKDKDTSITVRGLKWCGDGVILAPEECDDGNRENADSCTNACEFPPRQFVPIRQMPWTAPTTQYRDLLFSFREDGTFVSKDAGRTRKNISSGPIDFYGDPLVNVSVFGSAEQAIITGRVVMCMSGSSRMKCGTAGETRRITVDAKESYQPWYGSWTRLNTVPADTVRREMDHVAEWHTLRWRAQGTSIYFAPTDRSTFVWTALHDFGVGVGAAAATNDRLYVASYDGTRLFERTKLSMDWTVSRIVGVRGKVRAMLTEGDAILIVAGEEGETENVYLWRKDSCGNGIVDTGEACDDGNLAGEDYCNTSCSEVIGACGDGTKQVNEECDDGNTAGGDRCSTQCREIPLWSKNVVGPETAFRLSNACEALVDQGKTSWRLTNTEDLKRLQPEFEAAGINKVIAEISYGANYTYNTGTGKRMSKMDPLTGQAYGVCVSPGLVAE